MFCPFPKLARLNRPIVVTEKIDGTNAQVEITSIHDEDPDGSRYGFNIKIVGEHAIFAGSRNRYLNLMNDNMGFARWVHDNAEELVKLGPGRHFGEWWGKGIQRNYGLTEKRFSLFNTERWGDDSVRPGCCGVVPVLAEWSEFETGLIRGCVESLRRNGSVAVPGWMKPEGVVVFHSASGQGFKVTCENDDKPKSLVDATAAA